MRDDHYEPSDVPEPTTGLKALVYGGLALCFLALGTAVVIQQKNTPVDYDLIDQTNVEYYHVLENVEDLAQDWTQGLANAGLQIRDGSRWNMMTRRFEAHYVDRQTGPATIVYTPGKGKIAAYICEGTQDGKFLFHEYTYKAKMLEATAPLANARLIDFCQSAFSAAGLKQPGT